MFDDDDYEDYFVDSGSEEEEHRHSEPERDRTPDRRVIEFGGVDQPSARPQDARTQEVRIVRERQGCMAPWLLGIVVLVLVAFVGIGYFRYLSPIVDDAIMDVYVTDVQRRGVVFKTTEADVVVADRLVDMKSAYTHPVGVTVADDVTAHILQSLQASGKPVRVRYRQYAATLPWRGESKIIVTGIVRQ